jgi:hypothetical protein
VREGRGIEENLKKKTLVQHGYKGVIEENVIKNTSVCEKGEE